MLTIFDGNNGYPISQDDYYIRELASGYDEIIFNVNIRDEIYKYIKEEAIIRDRDQNSYLIKQIDAGEKTAKVIARINLDDWRNEIHFNYTNNSATVLSTVMSILPDGWTVIDHSGVTKFRTIPTSDVTTDYSVTGVEILEDCAKVYDVRFRFDTALKRVHIISPYTYTSMGAFATRDLNLRALNYKGKSEGFITRLYAVGADGLTFESINDGKAYVENRDYADKIVCGFWKDDRYTDKQSLLDDARIKLDALAVPSQSYDCDVIDLANTNPEVYGFEDFSLFQVVTLIDDAKEVRTDYQVVERWTYPYYPVKNKIILSLSTPNIQSAIQTVVNSITQSTSGFQQIIQSAIANATSLITGNSGGYLVLHDSTGDGTPDELLIMNTPDISTATKIWRWNQAGLGYSNHGYNGPYGLAINMDGSIVGDYIAANSIDGTSIRANTITAAQLTTDAKEEIAALHEYLSGNIFNDISLWTHGATAPAPYYETIGGKKYLVLDGTGLSQFNTNSWIRTLTDVRGDFNVKVHLTYHIDREVTITESTQRFVHARYYDYNSKSYRLVIHNIAPQTIPANTDFVWDVTLTGAHVDSSKGVEFGFYCIQGCKAYIEELSVYSSVDAYAHAGMDYNARGLSLLAEEVAREESHDYLPFDVMTNTDRWKPVYPMSDVSISHEQITVEGVTKDAIVLDGTSIVQTNDWQKYRITTDLIGVGPFKMSYKVKMGVAYTAPSTRSMEFIEYTIDGGTKYTLGTLSIPEGTVFTEGQEIAYNAQSLMPSEEIITATLNFQVSQGMKLYIYDLEITSTGEVYKSATLKFTADGLNSVVMRGDVISSVNQSAEQVSINASKIDLTGNLDLHGIFTTDTAIDEHLQGYYSKYSASRLQFFDNSDQVIMEIAPNYMSTDVGILCGIYTYDYSVSPATFQSFTQKGIVARKLSVSGDVDIGMSGTSMTVHGNSRFYGIVRNESGGQEFISDRRKKRNIKDLAITKARSFIMGLKPRKYKFKKGISDSNRYHHGFIAQELKEVMPEDWGVYCEDKKDDFIGLRYDEILADMVAVIQDQEKRIEKLENEVKSLKKIAKEIKE